MSTFVAFTLCTFSVRTKIMKNHADKSSRTVKWSEDLKKGYLSNCSKWRRTNFLNISEKIPSNIIYNRSKEAVLGVLTDEQSGFSEERGCLDHIFALRYIVGQCEEWMKTFVLNTVDFRKAFHSIHRPSKCKLLKLYRIPNRIVSLIKFLFETSENCVIVVQEHAD